MRETKCKRSKWANVSACDVRVEKYWKQLQHIVEYCYAYSLNCF